MYPAALQPRLVAGWANLRPVCRVVAGEPVRDVLKHIECLDSGAEAAWRRTYGISGLLAPERDVDALSI